MISDLENYENGTILQTDICIVGAGVAGLSLARELSGTDADVLVLESGGRKDELNTQRLYEAEVTGLPHEGVHNGRFRVYGGSSTRWGAQLMTYEQLDFSDRPYVNVTGWPLEYDEVASFYARAQDVLHVNQYSYEADLWKELGVEPVEFDSEKFHYRFSKWAGFRNRNLAKTVGPSCQTASNIRILLHANLVEIVPLADESSVDYLCIRSLGGIEATVRAKTFILCCGAIEVARVLLASRSVSSAGVGNRHDLVGRYFQDHISVRAARLFPVDQKKFTASFDPFLRDSTMHTCKVVMTPQAQEQCGSLNVMGHVVYGFTEESGFYELRKILRAVQSRKNPIPSPMGAWRILRYSSDIFRIVFGQFLARRRLSPRFAKCHLDIECEQAPLLDSRVSLSERVDALGMPLTVLHWKLTDLEKSSVASFTSLFRKEWERLSLGRAEWNTSVFEEGDGWMETCRDSYHHAGTTRMSADPAEGVVDADLKVHGIDNLYIASTSVFPTSGCENPTLTMMALCMRLADRLKQRES